MKVALLIALGWLALGAAASAQQPSSPPAPKPDATKSRKAEAKPQAAPAEPTPRPAEPREEERRMQPPAPPGGEPGETDYAKLKWDMREQEPMVTHHQITSGGKLLRYTATAGRLPIKDPTGTIEAEMFYVAYTLDGAEAARRPVTFAFNGGPGSASLWIHMGALGPRKVVLEKEGWMPESPYRLMDNPDSPLDKTDLVLVDAIGTGFSRAADLKAARKFWGVHGDAVAFGEFIRMYITRNERWSSPLYLLGESYGTTRSAAVAGYLIDRGIAFNGIMLLSMVLDFQTLEITRRNDQAAVLTLPTYTMIAMYHKKLPADLMQDMTRTREEALKWATTDYAAALAKGDSLTAEERQQVVQQMARYTGLKPEVIEWANLRVNVRTFTHFLLSDEKLRVGRLDGRFTGPDPEGFMETGSYDPANAAVNAPITSVFNDYVRRELGYKTDMPYYTSAGQLATGGDEGFPFWQRWEWGPGIRGFPDTAVALREAMAVDPYLKVMVMEGYYDLATPFAAADYTINHMDLPEKYHKNISFATYDSGHMVYLRSESLKKFHDDVDGFIEMAMPKGQ